MSERPSTFDRAEWARMRNGGWAGKSIAGSASDPKTSGARNRAVVKKMTLMELQCGETEEQFQARMTEQRLRVLKRYGVVK